jgi:nucleolar complex protein 3
MSQTEVYRDIMPGYRIRLPTEEELKTKVSKEVRLTRDFERALLNGMRLLYASFFPRLFCCCSAG